MIHRARLVNHVHHEVTILTRLSLTNHVITSTPQSISLDCPSLPKSKIPVDKIVFSINPWWKKLIRRLIFIKSKDHRCCLPISEFLKAKESQCICRGFLRMWSEFKRGLRTLRRTCCWNLRKSKLSYNQTYWKLSTSYWSQATLLGINRRFMMLFIKLFKKWREI